MTVVAPPTMAVYKYKLEVPQPTTGDLLDLELPKGATILRVGSQRVRVRGRSLAEFRTEFFLWALICKDVEETEKRKWLVVCTGQDFTAEPLKDLAWITAQRYPGAIAGTVNPFEHQETVIAQDGSLVLHFWISYPVTA